MLSMYLQNYNHNFQYDYFSFSTKLSFLGLVLKTKPGENCKPGLFVKTSVWGLK